jgi:citrate lyase beta subunit
MRYGGTRIPQRSLFLGSMKLILITNDIQEISLASRHGIHTILVDLERGSKISRQKGKSLFISDHKLDDLDRIRRVFPDLEIITRINSLHRGSTEEVDAVLQAGTDAVMVPYFQTADELFEMSGIIGGRAEVIPLFETIRSIESLESCHRRVGFHTCHFGLNDLALEQGWDSIFHAFQWPPFEQALSAARALQLSFGIAGVANQLDNSLPVDPCEFFARQVSLGGRNFWLSRSFRSILRLSDAESKLRENMAILNVMFDRYKV